MTTQNHRIEMCIRDRNLICVEDGIDSSKDSGKLMISVLSAVAEIERENILVQTMEGHKQKAREGKWNGGFAPYGLSLIHILKTSLESGFPVTPIDFCVNSLIYIVPNLLMICCVYTITALISTLSPNWCSLVSGIATYFSALFFASFAEYPCFSYSLIFSSIIFCCNSG